MKKMRFDLLIAELESEVFEKNFLGKKPFFGTSGRLAGELWETISLAFSLSQIPGTNIKIVADGKIRSLSSRILTGGLFSALNDGLTVVVYEIDNFLPSLASICADLSQETASVVHANCYISKSAVSALGAHWDDHDIFAMQLSGSKSWEVFDPTSPIPILDDVEVRLPAASTDFLYSLHAGDILYIPRGWWHKVTGSGELSAHLAIGIDFPTGVDCANFLVNNMKRNELIRANIPFWLSEGEFATYKDKLKGILLSEIEKLNIVDFINFRKLCLMPAEGFSLPRDFFDRACNSLMNAKLRWIAPFTEIQVPENEVETFELLCNGRKWEFSKLSFEFISKLIDGNVLQMSDFAPLVADPGTSTSVLKLCEDLIRFEVIAIV